MAILCNFPTSDFLNSSNDDIAIPFVQPAIFLSDLDLTFIAIILCLVAIIMVSCMIISCFKYCQRRRKDYVEQIDIEVQKYSKASSSYSG